MTISRTLRPTQPGTTAARRGAVALAATVVTAAALASSVPAYASGGNGGNRAVKSSSVCAVTGLLKLKAKPDTGGVLEVGGELDSNVNGQVWSLNVLDNDVSVWTGEGTTAAPSGAFGAAARIPNLPGQDVVTFVATMGTTKCSARVTVTL
jgi:hypothetical protein